MDVNFVDSTAQILFSDLLRRSDDLTDARVRAIAETSYRRSVMLSEVRKEYVTEPQEIHELSDVAWTEYRVKDVCKCDKAEDKTDNKFKEEEKEECIEVETEIPKKKRTWTRKTDKTVTVAASTMANMEPPKKKGRPKGSGKKHLVV